MEREWNVSALVEWAGGYATVRFADGSSQQVPRDIIARSTLLRQTFWSEDEEFQKHKSPVCVHLSAVMLRGWLRWHQIAAQTDVDPKIMPQKPCTSIPAVMTTGEPAQEIFLHLQAADFLIDQESVKSLCSLAAQALVPDPATLHRDRKPRGLSAESLQILGRLSDHLIIQVFAASQYSCLELIAMLPAEFHKLALESKYCTALKHRFMDPSRHELCLYGAPWEALLHSRSKHPLRTLKSLSIVEDFTEYEEKSMELRGLAVLTNFTANRYSRSQNASHAQYCLLPRLTSLELARLNHPDGDSVQYMPLLGTLTGLRYLSLQSSVIDRDGAVTLVQCMPRLICLQHLDLRNCWLGTGAVRALMASIGALSRLTYLDLSNNAIARADIPHHVPPDLVTQGPSACHPHFKMLGQFLSRLVRLETLCITEDKYQFSRAQFRALSLDGLRRLKHLDIPCMGDYWDIKDAMVPLLCSSSQLTCLKLKHHMFQLHGSHVFEDAFARLKQLKVLEIQLLPSRFRGAYATDVARQMRSLTGLRSLRLGIFRMNAKGATAMGKYLQSISHTLEHLLLSHVTIESLEFSQGLATLSRLTYLALNCTIEKSESASGLALALQDMARLKQLHLLSEFSATALEVLSPSVGLLTQLRELSFEGDMLPGSNIRDLVSELTNLSCLSTLSLLCPRYDDINDQDCEQLAKSLRVLPAFRYLILKHCEKSEPLLQHVAETVLANNSALEIIETRDVIRHVGAEAMMSDSKLNRVRRVLWHAPSFDREGDERIG